MNNLLEIKKKKKKETGGKAPLLNNEDIKVHLEAKCQFLKHLFLF